MRKPIIKYITGRDKRRIRVRKKVQGTPERPRVSVYRSLKHMYVQLVDDTTGVTLVSASTHSKDLHAQFTDVQGKVGKAHLIGKEIARRALERNITTVVFDRAGYMFHGRIKAVADGAREGGLQF